MSLILAVKHRVLREIKIMIVKIKWTNIGLQRLDIGYHMTLLIKLTQLKQMWT